MNTFSSTMTQLFRGMLLLLGLAMLFGGGVCVIIDINFGVQSGGSDLGLFVGVTLLAAAIAVAGWFIVKYTMRSNNKKETPDSPSE